MARAEKALGYDFFKIHPGVSREAFDSMAANADRMGIRFAGHVPLAVGIGRAVDARYWSVDHLDGYVEALARNGPPATAEEDGWFGFALMDRIDESRLPRLVAATRAAGVWMVPTTAFFEALMGEETVEQLLARPEMKYVADNFIRQWPTTTTQLRGDASATAETRRRYLALRRRILKAMHDGGVGVVLGSDAPQLWNAPGFSVARELGSYVAAGLTLYEALATGTRNVAAFLGNLAEAGTIEAGKRADLILLDANPLTDISNISGRAGVMVGGWWIPRAEIERRLAALAFR